MKDAENFLPILNHSQLKKTDLYTYRMAEKISSILKKYFGYETFRPLQKEIIEAVLSGNDAVVLMPTGGGKSLCFQIPALFFEGITIVVSPLIALMKDQVGALKAIGVEAELLNSTLSREEEATVFNKIKTLKTKILYVSPERLLTRDFYYFMQEISISLFAIDEAHCISAWGHDFRPEYTKLSFLKKSFPNLPIIALTATADRLTRKDIENQLGLVEPKRFIASFNRPNLSLKVLPGKQRIEQILRFLTHRPNQPGIIYCLSRNGTEEVTEKLRAKGYKAAFYHAGLSAEQRSQTQDDFLRDNVQIICATIAFGMGIDKSNVRWVIHYNLPKNIESYYQEIGRSGRDGLPADTILFYTYSDVIKLQSFVDDSGQKELQTEKLQRMMEYAEAVICRRKILLNYFSENLEEDCGNCDICTNPPKMFNATKIAQKALSAIYRMKEQAPMGMLIDVLRGALTKKIQDNNFHLIKTFGVGKEYNSTHWQQYLLQMMHQGFIEIAYDKGNALLLSEKSKDVLFKNSEVFLVKPQVVEQVKEETKKTKVKFSASETPDLFDLLRNLRKKLADEKGVPPYIIFSDATLHGMVQQKPINKEDMLNISGVGEKKFNDYGGIFISEIRKFLSLSEEYVSHSKEVNRTATSTSSKSDLKDALYTLRRNFALEQNISPENILSNSVLDDLILKKPTKKSELMAITGFDDEKFNLYGTLFISEIDKYLKKEDREIAKQYGNTYNYTFQLYKNGKTPIEICKHRNLSETTVYGHFAKLYLDGENIDILNFITIKEINEIMKVAINYNPETEMKSIFIALNEQYDYSKIRMALAFTEKNRREK